MGKNPTTIFLVIKKKKKKKHDLLIPWIWIFSIPLHIKSIVKEFYSAILQLGKHKADPLIFSESSCRIHLCGMEARDFLGEFLRISELPFHRR